MQYLKINNLEKYQKLGQTTRYAAIDFKILTDYKINQLNNFERWLWVGLIILACQCNNKLPYDAEWIANKVTQMAKNAISHTKRGIERMIELELLAVSPEQNSTDREIDRKKEIESFLIKYKNGEKLEVKPTFQGDDMRWVKDKQKWFVIVKGEWLEYADKESKIIWVKK